MGLATPEKIRTLQRKLYRRAKAEPDFRFHALYDKVYRRDILAHAYRLAKANDGAPGVDGVTFAMIEAAGVEEWLTGLQDALREKSYQAQPVRRTMIPKPGGGERPLGIPTIRDRVAQTAVKLVLEPIFEADFEANAYGYRPKRSARDAVTCVHRALCQGYTDVLDADLSKYFDSIPHAELLQSVARRIVDRNLLRLIKMWLKTPVEETDGEGRRRLSGGKHSTRGTPQGGIVSPLLANLYMNRFLKHWRRTGQGRKLNARLVSYADDFVVLSRGHAPEAHVWVREVMTRLGLALNEQKTVIRDAEKEGFNFLGYRFGPHHMRTTGQRYLGASASKKSQGQLRERIKAILIPSNMQPWPKIRDDLNAVLRGWSNYFSYGSKSCSFRTMDHYVWESVRQFLRRRHKVPSRRTHRFSYREVYGELGVLLLKDACGVGPHARSTKPV